MKDNIHSSFLPNSFALLQKISSALHVEYIQPRLLSVTPLHTIISPQANVLVSSCCTPYLCDLSSKQLPKQSGVKTQVRSCRSAPSSCFAHSGSQCSVLACMALQDPGPLPPLTPAPLTLLCPLSSSSTGLLMVSGHQGSSHHRSYAFTILSAWGSDLLHFISERCLP